MDSYTLWRLAALLQTLAKLEARVSHIEESPSITEADLLRLKEAIFREGLAALKDFQERVGARLDKQNSASLAATSELKSSVIETKNQATANGESLAETQQLLSELVGLLSEHTDIAFDGPSRPGGRHIIRTGKKAALPLAFMAYVAGDYVLGGGLIWEILSKLPH